MTLSPDQRYWLGWVVIGLISLTAEYFVVKWAIIAALRAMQNPYQG